MKKSISLIFVFFSIVCLAQENSSNLERVFRVNVLSPGIEFETPVSAKSTLSINPGIGLQGAYSNLSYTYNIGQKTNNPLTYYIAPFLDLSYKTYYNRDKRQAKGKSLAFNSGNYWAIRLLSNFKELETHNMTRTDHTDFAFGPTWGIQRAYGDFHLLFDLGPVYYFDTKGNNGFFPIMLQLNLGFDLKKWQ